MPERISVPAVAGGPGPGPVSHQLSERLFCGALREIAKDRPRVDTQSRRDFWRSEATGTQLLHPAGLDFRRPFLPATVHAFTLRSRNPSCLAFAAIFLFNLGQAKHDTGEQMEFETEWLTDMAGTADVQEGIAAFLAKRPPQFNGR